MQLQQLYSVPRGGSCACCGGEAVAIEGVAICAGKDSLGWEAQGDAGLPAQVQHCFGSEHTS